MIEPMLAKLADENDLSRKNYIWEEKFDGARCIAAVNGTTRLWSRSGREMTNNFPEIQIQTKLPAILDGEIISCDSTGKSVFNNVQHRTTRESNITIAMRQYPCFFQIFDILECNGRDVTAMPLVMRKDLLNRTVVSSTSTKVTSHTTDGILLFDQMKKQNREGVIGKLETGNYQPGKRVWLKVKVGIDDIFYIVGYTQGTGWRSNTFGALVLAKKNLPDEKEPFTYIGEVGTGFDNAMIDNLSQQMKALPIVPRAFSAPSTNATWILPKLQCLVHFAEYTKDGSLRFPSFKGLL